MITENWKYRRCAREFIEQHVDYDLIQDIIDIIPAIPSQNGYVDHWWVVFGPEDHKYKEWLVDNVYNFYHSQWDNPKTEYFTALITAPYVFHSFKLHNGSDQTLNLNLHIGTSGTTDETLKPVHRVCKFMYE